MSRKTNGFNPSRSRKPVQLDLDLDYEIGESKKRIRVNTKDIIEESALLAETTQCLSEDIEKINQFIRDKSLAGHEFSAEEKETVREAIVNSEKLCRKLKVLIGE